MVSGYTIKHSIGMVKGKSYAKDAARIREYGEHFFYKLKYKQYDSEEIVELIYLPIFQIRSSAF
jgi:hypothetical protein